MFHLEVCSYRLDLLGNFGWDNGKAGNGIRISWRVFLRWDVGLKYTISMCCNFLLFAGITLINGMVHILISITSGVSLPCSLRIQLSQSAPKVLLFFVQKQGVSL